MGYAGMDLIPKPNVTDRKDDLELAYLSKLSHAKRTVNPYFVHGRVQRELPDQPHVPPKTMMALPWLSKDKSSLLVPITSPLPGKAGAFDVDMLLDLTRYGFDAKDASGSFSVTQIPAYAGQKVEQDTQKYPGGKVHIKKHIPARDVVLLEIK